MDKNIMKLLSNLLEMVGILDEHIRVYITLSDIVDKEIYKNKKSEIRQSYTFLNSNQITELFNTLNTDFSNDSSMHIFLLSILLKCTHDIKILEHIVEIICLSNLNPYQSSMLEYQLAYEIITNDYSQKKVYDLRRKVHSFNVSKFKNILDIPEDYICNIERNKNRIIVISEQLLNINHAPSKIILEQCYTLQKSLGIEVLLIICPIHMKLNDQTIWSELVGQNYLNELNGQYLLTFTDGKVYVEPKNQDNKFIINYNDISIIGKQVLFEQDNFLSHNELLKMIYDFNPMFVYNMGSIHPLADLCKNFTTVVSSTMNYGYPVSDAQILLCLDDNADINGDDKSYEVLSSYNQVVLKHKIQFKIDEPNEWHNREEFEIPEDNFVIAIVGNRLSLEMTEDFIEILSNILDNDIRISILLIGSYENYQNDFNHDIFKNRIHYIGYQNDLVSVINIADIFLNPPRKGGGISALMSLYAGVPVITLPNCDVAGNVGEQFICNNYNEMIALINKYVNDKEFYHKQKEDGVEYTHKLSDSTANLRDIIKRINIAIMDMEKE